MTTAPPALELEGISKRFGAVVALDKVSLRVEAGHVHALLGENGAGKSTLMHVAFGMVMPNAGRVRVAGRLPHIVAPADAIAAGIGMVHQHFTLVPAMTVAENLALGGRGLLRHSEMTTAVTDIATMTGFALDPAALVETLSIGAQQRVEIAKAVSRRARVLILDEPTAVLAPMEVEDLLRWMRRFADAGNAVVLITHKLTEALAAADEVTVLRQGRVVFSGAAATTSVHELTTAMIGEGRALAREPLASERAMTEHGPDEELSPAHAVIVAKHITVQDEAGQPRLRDASLVIHAGEIVGVAGVEGSGQRELLRALAGRMPIASGSLERPEQVGFVPEDRHRDAVLLDRSLTDNVALRSAGQRRGGMPWRALRARAHALMHSFDVRAPSTESIMRTLSGGNQQKLVLAREMTRLERPGATVTGAPLACQALVVENPTRGLDVRATADVHARLRTARDAGAAIVLYSRDLDEVFALASRIVVVHAGALREVPNDRDAVGRALLGVA